MGKVLVLEDDQSIRSFIKINLARNAFEVLEAETGEAAIALYQENLDIDIAILDVMLPGISGLEVCEHMRRKNGTMGIIMLTAKSQETDKVLGLESGADDYMTKPFSPVELMARVKALYRRVRINEIKYIEEHLVSGPFDLNINTRECFKKGQNIVLTPTEFMMLKIFIESETEVLTRDDLLNRIWGENFYGDMKIVDVNIRRLRRKIEDDASKPLYIETVWGKGYKWKSE